MAVGVACRHDAASLKVKSSVVVPPGVMLTPGWVWSTQPALWTVMLNGLLPESIHQAK